MAAASASAGRRVAITPSIDVHVLNARTVIGRRFWAVLSVAPEQGADPWYGPNDGLAAERADDLPGDRVRRLIGVDLDQIRPARQRVS